MEKIDKILVRLGWGIEIFIPVACGVFSYYFIFANLDKADRILTSGVLLVMCLMNLTKVPLATALIFAAKFTWRFLFLIALLLATLVSFETYIQFFELYLVNNFAENQLMQINGLKYFLISLICSLLGITIAIAGIYLQRIKYDKKLKKYDEDMKNG